VRCIVKYKCIKRTSRTRGKLSGHSDYLERKSATINRNKPLVISNTNPESFRAFLPNEKHVHRFVFSPSEFLQLEMEKYVPRLMDEIAARAGRYHVGQSIQWRATVHTNTAHCHIHVEVHGINDLGEDVIFEHPETYGGGCRVSAEWVQDQETRGYVPTPENEEERKAALTFCPMKRSGHRDIDREIVRSGDTIDYDGFLSTYPMDRRQAVHARLEWLRRAGLLTVEHGKLVKVPDFRLEWLRQVQLLGRLKNRRVVRLGNPDLLMIATPSCGAEVGLVTRIDDKEPGQEYAIHESLKGRSRAIALTEHTLPLAEAYLKSGSLVISEGLELKAPDKPTEDVFSALGASGPVVDVIRMFQKVDKTGPMAAPLGTPESPDNRSRKTRGYGIGD
jgi:hypothetical protein